MRRGTLAVLAAAVIIGTVAGCAAGTGPAASTASTASTAGAITTRAPVSTTTSAAPSHPPYAVGTRVETYEDRTRPTAANRDYPGASTRTIRVRFFAPAGHDGAAPVVVFSHGHNSVPEAFTALFEALARAGYLVVAPAYPLSNRDAPGGATYLDLPNQPADAKFVLDQVLAGSRRPGHWLEGRADPARIGAAGHSMGGFTTYGLVYNRACGDPRVKAAVVLASGSGSCPGAYFDTPPRPLLVIHGERDATIPLRVGRESYDRAPPPKFMMTIVGGTHSGEVRGGTSPAQQAVVNAIVAFFDHALRARPGALAELRAIASQPGVTTLDEPG